VLTMKAQTSRGYRFSLLVLCALMAVAAARRVCRIHNTPVARKQVLIQFVVCRHNEEYWLKYISARTNLFPNSSDEVCVDFDKLANSRRFQKNGWKASRRTRGFMSA
jgi:hypothetical protein